MDEFQVVYFVYMNPETNKAAFTLLELIIVIIIVGVLASLALPRLLNLINRTYAVEALGNLKIIHQAVQRCITMFGFDDTSPSMCTNFQDLVQRCLISQLGAPIDYTKLGIDDPALSPNSHFTYRYATDTCGGGLFQYSFIAEGTQQLLNNGFICTYSNIDAGASSNCWGGQFGATVCTGKDPGFHCAGYGIFVGIGS